MTDSLQMNIITFLKNLDCDILAAASDTTIKEILFTPNTERYHLIEWIFSKLGCYIPDIRGKETSSVEKIKNLVTSVSDLGLCNESSGVIQGTAPFNLQLEFWNLLVGILWRKNYILSKNNHEIYNHESISDENERSYNYIDKLCHNINFKYFFEKRVQLFPEHLLKESKEACELNSSKIKTLAEIMEALEDEKLVNHTSYLNDKIGLFCENTSFVSSDLIDSHSEKLNDLEEKINFSLIDLQKHAITDFNEAYLNLKPHMTNMTCDETIDGSSFKITESKMGSLRELNKAFCLQNECNIKLKSLHSELKEFRLAKGPLSDEMISEYLGILEDERNLLLH